MRNMKKIARFTALLAVVMFAFSACEKPENNDPNGNQNNNDPKKRVVVYTVGNTESRQTRRKTATR